jgi:DNA-binding NarL/FixJ family response regulator
VLRVFIADDSLGFGTLASAWLGQHDDIAVVGAARNASDTIDALPAATPDVVILDRLLPSTEHSERVLAYVREALPATAVVLISGMPDEDLADVARSTGVDGHVSKATNATALAAAVRSAAEARRAGGA